MSAVKPWLLSHLLVASGGPVLYLDPDIEIYASLDDLADAAEVHDLVMIPQVAKANPADARRSPASGSFLSDGYHLGFLGVGPGLLDTGFFEWSTGWLGRNAISEQTATSFIDQAPIDTAGRLRRLVVRDPTCNLGYWNVASHRVARNNRGQVTVDGERLRFFHFSGFDARSPHRLSRHRGDVPTVLLSEQPVVAELCRRYAMRLDAEGEEQVRDTPYGWRRTQGILLDRQLRRLYRDAVIEAELAGEPLPPGPFTDGEAFVRWLFDPVVDDGPSRIAFAMHQRRPDLQAAFPEPLGADAAALEAWAAGDEEMRAMTPGRRSPQLEHMTRQQPPLPGVNITGYFSAELGIGEAARLVAGAAAAAGIPHALRVTTRTSSPLTHQLLATGSVGWPYDTNLFCVNADHTAAHSAEIGDKVRAGRRAVGLWFWETPRLPESMREAFQCLDEVWAASTFTRRALALDAPVPVGLVHLPIRVPGQPPRLTRRDLGLPEGFLVFYSMSFHSVTERKNPLGAVDAYLRAFGPGDGAHLVVKTVGGDSFWGEVEDLRAATGGRRDIHIVDGYIRSFEAHAMIAHCDCYLSLHRSEGFGLTMAEAMARGRPVVATGWSGNLDFMDEMTAHLVPYDLVEIPAHCDPYSGTGMWAEPDLDDAAEALRRIHDDPQTASALGARARAHIVDTRSEAEAGRRLEALLAAGRGRRGRVTT